ncbi:MAG: hypothetical protein JW704_11885, partial [Anaerolineaceae bacterium]|nr:hypothetical protein [Anaerolineaceae bacterium]
KKRLFKYLTDNEPKGAGWTNLDEKPLEIDEPEKLDRMMGKSFSGYHCLFRCFGEDGGEKFKACGYVFAGVAKTSNGVSVRPACT